VGSARRDFGSSYVGFLATARQNDSASGGYNRVAGPDFLWRWSQSDQVTGQFLYSDTETPDRQDLYPTWTGEKLTSHAAHLEWLHTARDWTWRLTGRDVGDDFRADQGFVPQVGYRRGRFVLFRNLYRQTGLVRRIQPYAIMRYDQGQQGDLLQRQGLLGVQLQGSHNSLAVFEVAPQERLRVEDRVLDRTTGYVFLQVDPGRRFSRVTLESQFGHDVDFANVREGHGAFVTLTSIVKPTDHLALELNTTRQWLDVTNEAGVDGRLFTAQIERLKATYNFTARSFLRVIGEYLDVNRRPDLYTFPVSENSGSFGGSALFAYRLNWQTVLFVGYGDDRVQNRQGDLLKLDRSVFFKVSYAFQG
jgi:hypothetical protein